METLINLFTGRPKTYNYSANYYHFVVNDTYNKIVLKQAQQHTTGLLLRAYKDISNEKGGIWQRTDGTVDELRIVLPVVQDYMIKQGILTVSPTSDNVHE
jgi:hypothetical protein